MCHAFKKFAAEIAHFYVSKNVSHFLCSWLKVAQGTDDSYGKHVHGTAHKLCSTRLKEIP